MRFHLLTLQHSTTQYSLNIPYYLHKYSNSDCNCIINTKINDFFPYAQLLLQFITSIISKTQCVGLSCDELPLRLFSVNDTLPVHVLAYVVWARRECSVRVRSAMTIIALWHFTHSQVSKYSCSTINSHVYRMAAMRISIVSMYVPRTVLIGERNGAKDLHDIILVIGTSHIVSIEWNMEPCVVLPFEICTVVLRNRCGTIRNSVSHQSLY